MSNITLKWTSSSIWPCWVTSNPFRLVSAAAMCSTWHLKQAVWLLNVLKCFQMDFFSSAVMVPWWQKLKWGLLASSWCAQNGPGGFGEVSALSALRAQLSLLGKTSPSRSRWPGERSRYMARCCCALSALSKTRNSHSLSDTRAICVASLPILCYLYVADSLNPSYARMAHSSHSAGRYF